MTDKSFFVYQHRRQDTGEIFYIGKGTRTPLKKYVRANTACRRNIHWRRVVDKARGFTAEVLVDFFVEADALAFEQSLIAQHGFSRAGGLLCNITAGGEGSAGWRASPETRERMSKAAIGRPKSMRVRQAVSTAQRGVPNPPEQNRAHALRMTGAGNPNFGCKNSPETIAKRVATRLRNQALRGVA